jgi:hypothetical protein
MKAQVDIIALYLRENCKKQIAAGLHNGRGIGDICVGYMSGQMPSAEMLAALPAPLPVAVPEKLAHLIKDTAPHDTSLLCTRGKHDGPCNGFPVPECGENWSRLSQAYGAGSVSVARQREIFRNADKAASPDLSAATESQRDAPHARAIIDEVLDDL